MSQQVSDGGVIYAALLEEHGECMTELVQGYVRTAPYPLPVAGVRCSSAARPQSGACALADTSRMS